VGGILCLLLPVGLIVGLLAASLPLEGTPARASGHVVAHARQGLPGRATTTVGLEVPGRPSPAVLAVRVTPARIEVLDRVTVAATLVASAGGAGRYAAILEFWPWGRGRTLRTAQGGLVLRPDRPLTVFWEWRAGESLPPGVYTVRVRLVSVAHPQGDVARGTARTPLTVVLPVQ
jgi:hypothetical protein